MTFYATKIIGKTFSNSIRTPSTEKMLMMFRRKYIMKLRTTFLQKKYAKTEEFDVNIT